MDIIPHEILEYHVFSYFSLNDWISRLTAVCKRWKRIIEASNSQNKLLELHDRRDEVDCIRLIQKYQPSFLQIHRHFHGNVFALPRMIGASKTIHTLIMPIRALKKIYNAKCLHQITTLVITNLGYGQTGEPLPSISELLATFPNLKRLQSHVPLSFTKEIKNTKQLEEVTLFASQDTNQIKLSVPMLRIISPGKITEKVFNDVPDVKDPLKTLTYEQYFRYYGVTKLFVALNNEDYTMAAQLLASGASIEYDQYLHSCQTYEYPALVQSPTFQLGKYLDLITGIKGGIKSKVYEALVQPKLLPIPTCCLFNTRAKTDPHSALKLLGDMKEYELPCINPEAFCQMLKPKSISTSSFKSDDIHRTVKFLVNDENLKIMDHFKHKCQFVKTWYLHDDLKKVRANKSDPKLFIAMVDKGCRIDPTYLREFIKTAKNVPQWRSVLDTIMKYEFHSDYDGFVKSSTFKNVKTVHENRWKRVGSLINYMVQHSHSYEKGFVQRFKHLVNHMDSLGNTPLMAIVDTPFNNCFSELENLLKLGADPNLHRKDQLSLIVRLCMQYDEKRFEYDNVALAIEYGADINAPCWFEKRMCSPLMIGVLKKFHMDTLLNMMAMGARLEYTDIYGKSVLDYAKQRYNDQEIRTLLYYGTH